MNKTVLTAALIISGIAQANELHPLCMSEEENEEYKKAANALNDRSESEIAEFLSSNVHSEQLGKDFDYKKSGADGVEIILLGFDPIVRCLVDTQNYYVYFKYRNDKTKYNEIKSVTDAYINELKKVVSDKERKEKAEKRGREYISSLMKPVE